MSKIKQQYRRRCQARSGANRSAFTLTELMVSIVIIAILSSVTLYAMASVQTLAKEQRTKSQIKRIHELIAIKWESFEDRSMRITTSYTNSQDKARARLYALREQMKLELPDRLSDVLGSVDQTTGKTFSTGQYDAFVPPASFRYFRSRATDNWSFTHQGAECLYMILSRIQVGDTSALENFSDKEIGDTDGDGMPEMLDAWGRPLNFVRWAPGFAGPSLIQTRNPADGGDAFDYMNSDPRNGDSIPSNNTFALFPLIFSNGADGEANIIRDWGVSDVNFGFPSGQRTVVYSKTADGSEYSGVAPNDPYVVFNSRQVGEVSKPSSDGHQDNIYSHFIETSVN